MYLVLFKIGPLTVYSLGLLWALGALAAVWILRRELKRYGYDPEVAGSAVFAAAIAGLLGARLLLILEEWESFTQAPFEVFFSGSGFSWYGGLIGGALAAAWVFRKHDVPLIRGADKSAPALALAYGIVQSLVVFAILWALRKRHHPPGTIFYFYLILAGSMRFIVEFWRANPIVALGMTEYQWISIALIIVGTGLLCYQWKPEQIKQSIKRIS